MIKNVNNNGIKDGAFVIPEGVVKILEWAFDGCTSLKNIIIPEGVTKIWNRAFEDCTSLKKVSLPKRIKLGEDVFLGCHPDLEIIYRD